MIYLRYARYLLRHKYFVFLAGRRTGVSLWRLLIHDWSKLTRAEWSPYAQKFFGPSLAHLKDGLARDARGLAFHRAWLHHQHHNPHHWQYWVSPTSEGSFRVLPMPEKFVREMVADWLGAGRAITGEWEATSWFEENREGIRLHPDSLHLVERLLARHGQPGGDMGENLKAARA